MDTAVAVAGTLLFAALLQLVLSRWRDLGPVTITCAGIAMTLAPGPQTGAVVALAAVLAAVGWARGARGGVGHTALDGLALAAAVLGNAAVTPLEGALPEARVVLASAQGAVGVVLLALALRRPSSLRAQVRWVGVIPVDAPAPASRKEAVPVSSPAESAAGPSP